MINGEPPESPSPGTESAPALASPPAPVVPEIGKLGAGKWWTSPSGEHRAVDLKTDQPHSARMYDYYLGGKDHFRADREAAERALASFPNARTSARENRAFLVRSIRHLASTAGIRQFLDIGTGIPTSPNLHEVAQGVDPRARVVYADNDPIVLTHARALLTSAAEGVTAYLDVDLHSPESILAAPQLRDTLDFSQPIALSVLAILHFFPDADDPFALVDELVRELPTGSYLTITHATADYDDGMERLAASYRASGIPAQTRSRDEILRFFDGLEVLDPGLCTVHRWRPDADVRSDLTDGEVSFYGAVARKA
ncbi:O-methyltransferase involved in polyketide biosynthesis [Frankia sp. AiPs1]|uniref:SAM-dependent methyltransferase n=1 Tax=Frankia sp. AiPa1 TaxID=573492 RepID=UPI00202B3072|nr:SAM-dependent methyltransferase [Frankia sp. AiPa1]MCL9758173.1 SAM-dependent methyltransferase [Frankia sp. AiPa1]